jgi:hypothetical protein
MVSCDYLALARVVLVWTTTIGIGASYLHYSGLLAKRLKVTEADSIEVFYPMLVLPYVFLDNAWYHAKVVQEWLSRDGA